MQYPIINKLSRPAKKLEIQCTVCKVPPPRASASSPPQSITLCRTASNNGYSVCKLCFDDMQSATTRRGRRSMCQQCPDNKQRSVVYTRHTHCPRGKPVKAYLCVDCVLRLVCVTDIQRHQVRQICSDPLIHAIGEDAASAQFDSKPKAQPRSLAEYSATAIYKNTPRPVLSIDIAAAEMAFSNLSWPSPPDSDEEASSMQ